MKKCNKISVKFSLKKRLADNSLKTTILYNERMALRRET
jgi:hypothetical protein